MTADLRIVVDGLGVLVPISDGLACWIDDLDCFAIICKTRFNMVLVYIAFPRGKEANWRPNDLEDLFFSMTGTWVRFWNEKMPVHEPKRDLDRQFAYLERWIPAIAVLFKADVLLCSTDEVFLVTQDVWGDKHLDWSPGGVIVSVPIVAGDEEEAEIHWSEEHMQMADAITDWGTSHSARACW